MKIKRMEETVLEVLALMMIGEGFIGLIRPKRYSLFWKIGPKWLRHLVEYLAQHPAMTRFLCVAELAAGSWLALREIEE